MTKRISGFATTLFVYTVTAGSALAQALHSNAGGNGHGRHGVASVPEIDAASGLLALAAVAALIALFHELRHRRVGSRTD